MSEKIKLPKRKKSKVQLFGKILDLPGDPFGRLAHITLLGNREINVEGCLGIEEYSGEKVTINLDKGLLSVCGEDFDVSDFSSGSIRIKGNIISVEFS